MIVKLKKLVGFVLKKSWQSGEKPLRKVKGESDRVERVLLETMLGFIDKALKENIITPEEAFQLRERYASRWRELNRVLNIQPTEETLQRLIKMKQLLQQEYESKLKYLEEQIKVARENFHHLIKGGNRLNRVEMAFNPQGLNELGALRSELLAAIERLEAMDKVGSVESN
ncbi:MAG: hypothetical protein QXO32_05955 [Candidatus Bathyarchaeia archaeon]